MEQKALLRMLILLLGFSYVLSLGSLKPGDEDPSVQELVEQGFTEGRNYGEVLDVKEGFLHGKMDVEINDYQTGPNHRHTPPPRT